MASHESTKYKINRGFVFKSVPSLCELKTKCGLHVRSVVSNVNTKYRINRCFVFKSVASLCELKAKLGLRVRASSPGRVVWGANCSDTVHDNAI